MSDPFIGEVRMFPYHFVPQGWFPCDGSEYSVQSYEALYAIIGNTFGGTASKTFKVPDLRGRAACGAGTGPGLTTRQLGNAFGDQTVTLSESNMPAHTHSLQRQSNAKSFQGKTTAPNNKSDLGSFLLKAESSAALTTLLVLQNSGSPNTVLHPSTIGPGITETGTPAGQANPLPHNNMQPYQPVQHFVAYLGIFPMWD